MHERSAQKVLAASLCALTEESLPAPVQERAVVFLLDAVGLALRARGEPTVRALSASLAGNVSSSGEASVWGSPDRTSAEIAALLNGTAVHAHFQDDTDMDAWVHPGSLVVPTAVAVGEGGGLTVHGLVRSIVAGYTALHWLGAEGAVGRAVVHRGFRASAVLGPIGAAAAAAVALRLGAERTEHALGLAADLAGGTVEPVRAGFQSWRVQNGTAGFLGVLAAKLAGNGVATSPASVDRGWLTAHAGADLRPGWLEPPVPEDVHGVWQKHFPTLGDNIAACVAAAALHPSVDVPAVTRVVVRIAQDFAQYPGTSFRGPFVRVEQALASTAFAVSSALTRGELDYEQQRRDLGNHEINRLVSLTEVQGDPSFGYLDAEVVVETPQGVSTSHSRDCPRTLFFRDLDSARRLFEATCADAAVAGGSDFCSVLLAWLDGGPDVPVEDLMSRLTGASGTPREEAEWPTTTA